MLISEELLLLLVNDEGKDESWGTYRGYGLAGAVLADLVVAGRLELDAAKDPRMTIVDVSSMGHPVLDVGLAALEGRDGKRLSSMISGGRLKPEGAIAQSLADAGVVRIEEKRMLGMVPARYPVLDPAPEQATRRRIASVLRGSTPPTEADLAILGILEGLSVTKKVIGPDTELDTRQLKARVKELAADNPSGTAVGRSVQSMAAAMTTAAIIPVIISSGS